MNQAETPSAGLSFTMNLKAPYKKGAYMKGVPGDLLMPPTRRLRPTLYSRSSGDERVASFNRRGSATMNSLRIGVLSTIFSTVVLSGCASSSGVVSTGADRYSITVSASPGRGGVPAAKRMAYEEAAAACAKRPGQSVETVDEVAKSPTWTEGMAVVTLNFRCIAAPSQ